jgi:hypothetical protein
MAHEFLQYIFAIEYFYHTFALAKTKEDSVAQLVEHIPFKDGVLGSSPSWITKQKGELEIIPLFYVYIKNVFTLY